MLLSAQAGSLLSHLLQHATLTSASTAAGAAVVAARSYHVARLASRGVVSLSGPESVQFLQGMTTNDVKPLEQPGAGPIYTVLLTAKGKYLHDLFAYSIPGANMVAQYGFFFILASSSGDQQHRIYAGEGPHLLLDVDAAGVNSAVSWLNKYKLRRKLQITNASHQYSVWVAFDGNFRASGAGQWRQDPRLSDLGVRGIFDAQQLPPPPPAGDGSSSRKQQAAGMSIISEEAFQRWRYLHGVAEGDKDIPTGEVAPLECNLDALHGISYTKGCYIGQERNSYTHYRGIIRKRMMPVEIPGLDPGQHLPCPVAITSGEPLSDAAAAASKKRSGQVGVLTNNIGDLGMAYMRLTAANLKDGSGNLVVDVDGQAYRVVPRRPEWWPSSWGNEDKQSNSADS